jgi:hypothetical protein
VEEVGLFHISCYVGFDAMIQHWNCHTMWYSVAVSTFSVGSLHQSKHSKICGTAQPLPHSNSRITNGAALHGGMSLAHQIHKRFHRWWWKQFVRSFLSMKNG